VARRSQSQASSLLPANSAFDLQSCASLPRVHANVLSSTAFETRGVTESENATPPSLPLSRRGAPAEAVTRQFRRKKPRALLKPRSLAGVAHRETTPIAGGAWRVGHTKGRKVPYKLHSMPAVRSADGRSDQHCAAWRRPWIAGIRVPKVPSRNERACGFRAQELLRAEIYNPVASGSFLNDFSTASRSDDRC
jgi:hypothetical protein